MATVLAGTYGADPSTIWPEKYSSCYWNFTTGWVCETVETPQTTPPVNGSSPQPLGNTPDPNANVMLPVVGGGSGCCGRCGGGTPSLSPTAAVTSGQATTVTTRKCVDCKCGYTNREAILAVILATAFLWLWRK